MSNGKQWCIGFGKIFPFFFFFILISISSGSDYNSKYSRVVVFIFLQANVFDNLSIRKNVGYL